jgi:hypothetical protein
MQVLDSGTKGNPTAVSASDRPSNLADLFVNGQAGLHCAGCFLLSAGRLILPCILRIIEIRSASCQVKVANPVFGKAQRWGEHGEAVSRRITHLAAAARYAESPTGGPINDLEDNLQRFIAA